MKPSNHEWTRIYRVAGDYPIDLVHARYTKHRFARHAHEHFVIGLVEEGVQQYRYRGTTFTTPAGGVFFVNSGEAHTGEPGLPGGYLYRTLCFSPEMLSNFAARLLGRNSRGYFRESVVHDPELVKRLGKLHRSVSEGSSSMANEWCLQVVMEWLLSAYLAAPSDALNTGRESQKIKRVREYIEANYAQDIPLSHLGEIVSGSPFHIARTFTREVGLPPHGYLESVRIGKARELLAAGIPVVDVALAVGYADQSHFSNRFRRITGVTPGQYRRR